MVFRSNTQRQSERGGVSIFIVIFTALLITIVTTSFTQLMVRNQQQATNNDLSQSAYDAALAGVEDAKRLLVKLARCDKAGEPCADDIRTAISENKCDTLKAGGLSVQNDAGGEEAVGAVDLNQAYTCVKIQTDRPYIDGDLEADTGSKTLRLKVKDGDEFNRVRISWYTEKNLQDANAGLGYNRDNATSPNVPDPVNNSQPLHQKSSWGTTTPPIMRAQLIQFRKNDVKLSAFSSSNTPNAKTAFLYPNFSIIPDIATTLDYWTNDHRPSGSGSRPQDAGCVKGDTYMCSVVIELPDPEGGTPATREAYLQLAALYNATSFKVELYNGASPVNFKEVEPVVDSTGRASDLFRRVRASVSVGSVGLPVPDAALNVNGNVCKNFSVTNDSGDYQQNCTE